jgi:hypothetical protein
MNRKFQIHIFFVFLLFSGCVTQFTPDITEEKELLVVQGLFTDQPEADTIKLSKSLPLGKVSDAIPVTDCDVTISDNLGSLAQLSEIKPGTYVTPGGFHGYVGRFYTLHITKQNINYESVPMEMKPVPPIDTIYYEKTVIEEPFENSKGINGCQIYLNTHDPSNECKYYRWDFTETWKLRMYFEIPNNTCWLNDKSHSINIKSTAAFDESRINRLPVQYITNVTDRLKTRYSIQVNQYSMSEDEFSYWEKIQNVAVEVGGLYDLIPASIPSNLVCIERPDEQVLGYFSVSAKASKRIYIEDKFEGIIDPYVSCVTDTIPSPDFHGNIGVDSWIIIYHRCSFPCAPWYEVTTYYECADCTTRGTNVKPDFWVDE